MKMFSSMTVQPQMHHGMPGEGVMLQSSLTGVVCSGALPGRQGCTACNGGQLSLTSSGCCFAFIVTAQNPLSSLRLPLRTV